MKKKPIGILYINRTTIKTMKLFFNILNLNEHKPAFEEDKQKYVYIRENRPVGAVVAELKATDGDVDSNVSWYIKFE